MVIDGFAFFEPMLAPAMTLLRHNYRREEIFAAFEKFKDGLPPRILLYMEFAPEKLIPELRRALREGKMESPFRRLGNDASGPLFTPWGRAVAAALLSIVDRPWSRQELKDALTDLWDQYRDPNAIARIAIALAESKDPKTREFAKPWLDLVDKERLQYEQEDMQSHATDFHEHAMKIRSLIEPQEGAQK